MFREPSSLRSGWIPRAATLTGDWRQRQMGLIGYVPGVPKAGFWALAVVLLAVAGCGGGSSKRLTKEEYTSQADAICGKYNQQVKALDTNPTNLSELADVADKTIPILDNAIDDLHKLKPPASEQGTADRWLSQVENLKDDLTEIRDKAKAKDMQGVQAVVPKAQEHNSQSNQLATQLGMSVCNKD